MKTTLKYLNPLSPEPLHIAAKVLLAFCMALGLFGCYAIIGIYADIAPPTYMTVMLYMIIFKGVVAFILVMARIADARSMKKSLSQA